MRENRRITINLTEKASQSLAAVVQASGLNQTDVTNRALQVYAFMTALQDQGGDVRIRFKGSAEEQVVRFL